MKPQQVVFVGGYLPKSDAGLPHFVNLTVAQWARNVACTMIIAGGQVAAELEKLWRLNTEDRSPAHLSRSYRCPIKCFSHAPSSLSRLLAPSRKKSWSNSRWSPKSPTFTGKYGS